MLLCQMPRPSQKVCRSLHIAIHSGLFKTEYLLPQRFSGTSNVGCNETSRRYDQGNQVCNQSFHNFYFTFRV